MNIPENILSKLTDEQKKRVETANSPEDFLAVAKEVGYELTTDQLDSMSGGWTPCPDLSSRCIEYLPPFV